MSYTSIAYLGFILMGSFFFYSVVPLKHKWKVLLIFSYLFYFINSGKYVVFILFSSLSIYFGGRLLNKIDDGFSMAKKVLPKENKKELGRRIQKTNKELKNPGDSKKSGEGKSRERNE